MLTMLDFQIEGFSSIHANLLHSKELARRVLTFMCKRVYPAFRAAEGSLSRKTGHSLLC